ncbi:hypothetical protein ES703_75783 [subsurface metagenome]
MLGFHDDFLWSKDFRLFFAAEATYIMPTFGTRVKPLQTFYARRMYLDSFFAGWFAQIVLKVVLYQGNTTMRLLQKWPKKVFWLDSGRLHYISLHLASE